MKTYILKNTIKDLEGKQDDMTFFLGKDGYVQEDIAFADGYERKGNALRRLQQELTCFGCKKVNDYQTIESNRWLHTFEIVEYEAK